jgi:hypothetical protein
MASLTFKELQPNEAWPLVFDFTPDLSPGETLTGINGSVGIVTVRGVDSAPAHILNGIAALDSTSKKVVVPVKPDIDGCDYRFTVSVNTTNPKKTPIIVAVLPVRS